MTSYLCLPKQLFFFPLSFPWHLLPHCCRSIVYEVIQTALRTCSSSAYLTWWNPQHLHTQHRSAATSYPQCHVRAARTAAYLVGVVGADVAECRGSWLTEQRRGIVVLETIHIDVLRMRDVGERRREGRWRADRGWGGGREVGQALREAVHVDLDLWVVKVFLAVAVVRVTVPAAGGMNSKCWVWWTAVAKNSAAACFRQTN